MSSSVPPNPESEIAPPGRQDSGQHNPSDPGPRTHDPYDHPRHSLGPPYDYSNPLRYGPVEADPGRTERIARRVREEQATRAREKVPSSNPPDRMARTARDAGALGILRIEIHGSWLVADLIKLLGRLEDAYKAAAAFELLADDVTARVRRPSSTADDLLQRVTAFRLAGGLRLGSLSYGSPGFVEVIGAFNPLKTVKEGITENREINRRRDETRRLDERVREQQAMQHEEAMARLRLEAEAARFGVMNNLIDRLPRSQQSAVAAQLLQQLVGAVEAIAADARVDSARMLEQGGHAVAAAD
jgi:hypothetical protein